MVDKTKQLNKNTHILIKRVVNGWIIDSWFDNKREYICTTDEEVVRRVEQLLTGTEEKR